MFIFFNNIKLKSKERIKKSVFCCSQESERNNDCTKVLYSAVTKNLKPPICTKDLVSFH